jgi:hypothetical protein
MVLVYDRAAKKLRWHKDGVLVGERDDAYDAAATSSNSVYIGKGYVQTFNGSIGDVLVYDRALGADEIKLLFGTTPPAPCRIAGARTAPRLERT